MKEQKPAPTQVNPLEAFHSLVAQWFTRDLGSPTDIQIQSWPRIMRGEHVLISAPTGSGKTLTAFLWAINQLITGKWTLDRTRILYISPLKALNMDIRRNLSYPLLRMEELFLQSSIPFPEIRIQTRSGDTPQSDRRRMLRHPPEILITTPESLNILLSSAGGKSLLTDLSCVILDEIHTIIGTKRGTHLITAVDRLVPLSGEFQRIALSATMKPMEIIAEFVGGFQMEDESGPPSYTPRKVAILKSKSKKRYDLKVKSPSDANPDQPTDSFWNPYVKEFAHIIKSNRSTLLFTNSRRLCESMTLKLNSESPVPYVYAHHGSLAKEIRHEVELSLKNGRLSAIVATNSLELGIDIGSLDEVVMVQSPPSISSAIQRIGRAGHQVGEICRGTFFPTHDQDFLESAVLANGVQSGDIENNRPIRSPLDVLAQILLSMVGTEIWNIDLLFNRIRASWPYRNLTRSQFDLVLFMLEGRSPREKIREIKARVIIDRLDHTVTARRGALLDLYISGGTIPDRGTYNLRHAETGALIGDLDEEFVWEATIGQTFNLGTQHWIIQKITHNDVIVLPAPKTSQETPFWKAEPRNRDFHFSRRIAEFLERASSRLKDSDFTDELQKDFRLEQYAAARLIDYLRRQERETGVELPHRGHLVIEQIRSGPGGGPGNQVVLHTFWGGRVNRPFAMALDAAWEERYGHRLEIYPGNDCVALLLPHPVPARELISLVGSDNLETLIRHRLEGSGFFGARFRECAGRALLITKRKINERLPLWMSRLKSQKLLRSTGSIDDFPILLEAWRTCLQDEFDMEALKSVLREIESGRIRYSECLTPRPSPMAQALSRQQVNQYMYAGEESKTDRPTGLRSDLLREVVFSPGMRPGIPPNLILQFERKRQRISTGYSPSDWREILQWIKERWLVPQSEWIELMEACERDHEFPRNEMPLELEKKLVVLETGESGRPMICALENVPNLKSGLLKSTTLRISRLNGDVFPQSEKEHLPGSGGNDGETAAFIQLGEWLRYYGPMEFHKIQDRLGIDSVLLTNLLDGLLDSETIIRGELIRDNAAAAFCDAENFEILLRWLRSENFADVKPRPLQDLPLFLADHQGLTRKQNGLDDLFHGLEQLSSLPQPAGFWETEIMPARFQPYHSDLLDRLLRESGLRWKGSGGNQIVFFFESEADLIDQASPTLSSGISDLFPDSSAHYNFSTLQKISNLSPAELNLSLWEKVWNGSISNDSFGAVRRGILNNFKIPENRLRHVDTSPRHFLTRHTHRREAPFYAGNWYLHSPPVDQEPDILDEEERKKDRVRILLDRYGILFREILKRESRGFSWKTLFRTLRLMELSGEILAGYFFKGISGPQFISPAALRRFQSDLPQDSVFWMNAADPVSLCGRGIEDLRGTLPRRLDGNHLVYMGTNPVLISRGQGKTLSFFIPPDHPRLPECLGLFHSMLTREFHPMSRIIVETVNFKPAPESPYLPTLRNEFEVAVDIKRISLYRKRGE